MHAEFKTKQFVYASTTMQINIFSLIIGGKNFRFRVILISFAIYRATQRFYFILNMATTIEVADGNAFHEAIASVRSDATEDTYVLCGHVNGDPNRIQVIYSFFYLINKAFFCALYITCKTYKLCVNLCSHERMHAHLLMCILITQEQLFFIEDAWRY